MSSTSFQWITRSQYRRSLSFEKNIDPKTALKIAHQAQGNFNKALQLLQPDSESVFLKNGLLTGLEPFRAKGNAAAIQDLILWSEQIAGLGRNTFYILYRNVSSAFVKLSNTNLSLHGTSSGEI
jgi:DNA polymerase-3 subunit delta'